ncbi:MAG: thioredoxin family protein [Chitinispirillales bacterium]|jgi:cytochrome c biogenesis protein CcdA/thiol-disulfide isomerase/thioredoxin|nr:thioredoxin family protein [Chitinispirillales bacterium]
MKRRSYTFIAAIAILAATIAFGQNRGEDSERTLTLESFVCKDAYGIGDTVTVEIKVGIPRGYHLYSNPHGPGIGRPLGLYVNKSHPANKDAAAWSIRWNEARKNAPKRFNPPVGRWVWAFETETHFFIRGVVGNVEHGARNAIYDVIIDALICRTDCIPVRENIPVVLHLSTDIADAKNVSYELPPTSQMASNWRSRLAKSQPMEFRIGVPDAEPFFVDNDEDRQQIVGLKLDFGGLGELGAGSGPITEIMLSDENDIAGITGSGVYGDDGNIVLDYSPRESGGREYNFLTAILFALIVGLALNLTPCIFPVLSIRVLSFAESAQESRRRAVVRSIAFACGIVSVFLLLAALAAFAGLSWGQQFQNPAVMLGVIAMIFFFALGMFDFYTLGIPSAISNAERKAGAGLGGDFLKGAMATVLATPCGGPFLGALLAWALLQNPVTIFVIFALMGVGMALPYILLSSSKRLLKILPKPGRWIQDLKYAMGFLLLVFAVVMLRSLDPSLTVTAAGIALSILCAVSINKRFAPFGSPISRRVKVVLISIVILIIGIVISLVYLRSDVPLLDNASRTIQKTDAGLIQWSNFSSQALSAAHEEGRNVIVNFTASWCTNCKLNELTVLNTLAAQELYAEKDILLLTADITHRNPQAQSLLHRLGSRSIPFIAIFSADAPESPIVMRDILSKDRFLEALRELP